MKPGSTPRAQAELAARQEREAAALRANLRRRKDQQRATLKTSPPPLEGEASDTHDPRPS